MIRRNQLIVAIAVAAACAAAAPASAGTWTRIPLPRLHPGRGMPAFGQLLGVACLSPRWCEAVGAQTRRSTGTLVEHWNGSRWSRRSAPNVPRSANTTLTGISCTSSRDCWAAGEYARSRAFAPLVEHWNGTRWSLGRAPPLVGGLASVSCPRPSACVAVGFRGTDPSRPTTTPLIERLRASRWTPEHIRFRARGPLQSLSCSSPSACTAVGNEQSVRHGSGDLFNGALVQRWEGMRWSPQIPAQVAGASSTGLIAVSCPATSACVAAGFYDRGPNEQAVAEGWDGTRWSVQPIAVPASVAASRLLGISCAAVGACAAVGGYQEGSGGQGPLAARWDGVSWEVSPLGVKPGSPAFELNAVSCSVGRWCMAVGDAYATRYS